MKRYQDGLQLMQKAPWIELGKVNGIAVSIDSLYAMDSDTAPDGIQTQPALGQQLSRLAWISLQLR